MIRLEESICGLVNRYRFKRIPFEVSAQPTISRAEAESLFLQKMKAVEDEVAKGNYKTSEEMHMTQTPDIQEKKLVKK